MNLFLIDEVKNYHISYEELVREINLVKLKKYVYYSDPKDVFFMLVKSLAFGKDIIFLDGDWSSVEIESQGISLEDIQNDIYKIDLEIVDILDLYHKIEENINNWSITLYTSGTTGKPKKVRHNFSSVSRALKKGEKYKDNIWLFSYNPTHIAGLQVFLQAFLNKNTIIIANKPNIYNINLILNSYKITNISATPTFYRFILPTIKDHITSVQKVTLGGEKMDENLKILLIEKFPLSKIINVYASTEAGNLFASDGEYFNIDKEMATLIKIDNNELFVNKKLVGEFDYTDNDEWYKTGDFVEYLDGKLKFLQRENDFINVGGYKVNPLEVEEEILKMNNIIDVLVYGLDNKLIGKILIADVVLEQKEENINKRIFNHLKDIFQNWKIPRVIKIKDTIETTNTGKKVRKK